MRYNTACLIVIVIVASITTSAQHCADVARVGRNPQVLDGRAPDMEPPSERELFMVNQSERFLDVLADAPSNPTRRFIAHELGHTLGFRTMAPARTKSDSQKRFWILGPKDAAMAQPPASKSGSSLTFFSSFRLFKLLCLDDKLTGPFLAFYGIY
jgi:hypothetical protein